MTERAQLAMDWPLLTLVVTAVVALAVGGAVVAEVTSPEAQAYMQQAGDWCADHGGDLYNAQTFGQHAGLHCEMDARTVHMHDVAEHDWPDDPATVPDHETAGMPFDPASVGVLVAILAAISIVVLFTRRRTDT